MRASLLIVAMTLAMAGTASAEVPPTLSFAARIQDGETALTGSHAFTFRLYDVETGGSALWSETHESVGVDEGMVNVTLGVSTPMTSFVLGGTERWIEIVLDGDTMSPRLPLRSVPYAVRTGDADTVAGLAPTAFAPAVHEHDAAYVNAGGDTMTGVLTLGAGGKFSGIAVGSSQFGAVPYPYETIQLDPSFNLRFAFGVNERMVLANDGRLVMSQNPGDCPAGWFCNGMFWDLSVASILYSGLSQRSDARLKKDIEPIEGGLETIRKLRPVTFTWRDPAQPGRQNGFIAQEVREVLPDLVSTTPDGTLALDTTEMLPILMQAVQELDAQNAELRARLDAREPSKSSSLPLAPIGIGAGLGLVGLALVRRRRG